jgi:hypothetical protein
MCRTPTRSSRRRTEYARLRRPSLSHAPPRIGDFTARARVQVHKLCRAAPAACAPLGSHAIDASARLLRALTDHICADGSAPVAPRQRRD